ncbi:MAG: sugar ABC transporter ATP-binding protein [Hydrogenoanaerobacterium sp.]
MQQNNPFLSADNISKTFPGVKALDNIHFDIFPGEVHSLVGENGAGKSTFIKILSGVQLPDDGGIIKINGDEVTFFHTIDAIHQGIAVIYQDFSLFQKLTVAENIVITQTIQKHSPLLSWKEINQKAKEALDTLNTDIDPKTILENLSIAKQQIVAIAGAIAQKAKLVIMDEPTSSLSKVEIENLYDIIERLKKDGIAILFISHKMDEIFRLSDRITVFRDGQYVATSLKNEITQEQLISQMVGRTVEIVNYANLAEKGEVVLEVEKLSQKGNFKDISFKLHKGELLGVSGLVGAGRSELAQAIFGIKPPDSGTIKIDGKAVVIKSPRDALKHGIAYIPESRQTQGLILEKSVESNITLPLLRSFTNRFGLVNHKEQRESVDKWVHMLDVRPNNADFLAIQLSGGNQQKVVLAKWISTQPKILIVDEPTNGVDIGAKSEIYKILRNIAQQGASVIVVSSELPEILSVSDRILVMRKGRISAEFENVGVTQEMLMSKALKMK